MSVPCPVLPISGIFSPDPGPFRPSFLIRFEEPRLGFSGDNSEQAQPKDSIRNSDENGGESRASRLGVCARAERLGENGPETSSGRKDDKGLEEMTSTRECNGEAALIKHALLFSPSAAVTVFLGAPAGFSRDLPSRSEVNFCKLRSHARRLH